MVGDFDFEDKWLIHAYTDGFGYGDIWLDSIFHRQVIHLTPVDRFHTEFNVTYYDRWTGEIGTEQINEYQQVMVVRWINE